MAIQRWDPLRDLVDLQEKMKRLFDEVLARSAGSAEPETLTPSGWRPPIDLYEEPQRYVLRADLPGVDASDVEIQVDGNTLTLRGERQPDGTVAREAFLRVERPRGPFAAQLELPPSVDPLRIEAVHRNGVIEVSLPKREDASPGRIHIQPAG